MGKNIAVDTGFGYGIVKSGEDIKTIPSYIEKISNESRIKDIRAGITEDDAKSGDKILIKVNTLKDKDGNDAGSAYFLVGNLALQENPSVERYGSMDRVGCPRHLAHLLALIGIGTTSSQTSVNLGVGLPNKLKSKTDDTKKWLTGKFDFELMYGNGVIARSVTIDNIEVVGQSIAPIFTVAPEKLKGTILSIDLGHGTNDYCLWKNGQIPQDYRLNKDGFYKKYTDMKLELEKAITNVNEHQVQKALETGILKVRQKEKNFEATQERILKEYAQEEIDFLISKYEKIFDEIDEIVVSGGIMENDKFFGYYKEKIEGLDFKIDRNSSSQNNVVNGLFARLNTKFREQ